MRAEEMLGTDMHRARCCQQPPDAREKRLLARRVDVYLVSSFGTSASII